MALQQVSFFDLRYDHRKQAPVCFLKDVSQDRYLPIWISEEAVEQIEHVLRLHTAPAALLQSDLGKKLAVAETLLDAFVVDGLVNRSYLAHVVVSQAGVESKVHCRPSEGVAFALLNPAGMFVAEELMYRISFIEWKGASEGA